MNYTIAEVSELIDLSKVSIYKKLKLKELKGHIIKKKGITYIDEVGFNLIKFDLKVPLKEGLKDFKEEATNTTLNDEVATDIEDLNLNKELFKLLKEQLKEKDIQIKELHRLLENGQVLLKEKPKDLKLLEEHFQDLDTKLSNIREQMENKDVTKYDTLREPKKGLFKGLFKK